MTNLEWLNTLSAEELADWFYDEWLHHLQYRWSSSRGGLIIWLRDRKTEPMETTDYCKKCNHKGCDNCVADVSNPYCVPSRYEPKDEPQPRCPKCGKRGYIRSLESMGVKLKVFDEYRWKCTNCNKYFKEEPKTEPQTERSE